MNSLLRRTVPVAILLLLGGSGLRADDTGHLVTATGLGNPVLRLSLSGDAFVRQTASVDLHAGVNIVSFAFGRLDIPLDDLELDVAAPAEGVTVSGLVIALDSRDTVQWELAADKPCQASLVVGYPLKGIEWRIEYAGTITRDAEALDLTANLVLTNRSKLEFAGAKLELPGGQTVQTDLKQNDTFQLALFSAPGLPLRTQYIYDPSRYGGDVAVILRVLRDRPDPFSAAAVTGGKVRIYSAGAPASYIGEDNLPYLPAHEPADIRLGSVPDVTVTRKLVKATQVDVKSDIRDRLGLFNEDDEVEFEVKNPRKSPLVLSIFDNIDGDWKMLRSALPFEKTDAGTIQFVVNMQAGETRKVNYLARRFNLEP